MSFTNPLTGLIPMYTERLESVYHMDELFLKIWMGSLIVKRGTFRPKLRFWTHQITISSFCYQPTLSGMILTEIGYLTLLRLP